MTDFPYQHWKITVREDISYPSDLLVYMHKILNYMTVWVTKLSVKDPFTKQLL